jgi:hypothetical protein
MKIITNKKMITKTHLFLKQMADYIIIGMDTIIKRRNIFKFIRLSTERKKPICLTMSMRSRKQKYKKSLNRNFNEIDQLTVF